jgi:TRAP-type C4-dicarboxylate transport system permease small subunit
VAEKRPLDPPAIDAVVGPDRPVVYTLPERVIESISLALFVTMLLATLSQVGFRYLFALPMPWTEELARTFFVMAMFTAMAFAMREDQHIVVDFLLNCYPSRVRKAAAIVFSITILFFLAVWARGTISLAQLNWNSNLVTLPWIRVAYLYWWELLGIALMALYLVIGLARNIREVKLP